MKLHMETTSGFDGFLLAGALAHLGVSLRPPLEALRQLDMPCILRECAQDAGLGMQISAAAPPLPPETVWPVQTLRAALEALPLPPAIREQISQALRLIAEARAGVFGILPQQIAFSAQEGMALLQSLTLACWGLVLGREALGITRITASPLPWQSGMLHGPRGCYALPSPVTARLLQGLPVHACHDSPETAIERLPPDGAALAHLLPDAFEAPEGIVRGLGLGYRAQSADVWLRLWLLDDMPQPDQTDAQKHGGMEAVVQLETHLDHLTGEELGAALEALAALPEVLDILWLPGLGKKSRPSGALRVLCTPPHRDAVTAAILRHTHTLGVRHCLLQRTVLPRSLGHCAAGQALNPDGLPLPAKLYSLEGRLYARPEADAMREAAAALGVGTPALRVSAPAKKV